MNPLASDDFLAPGDDRESDDLDSEEIRAAMESHQTDFQSPTRARTKMRTKGVLTGDENELNSSEDDWRSTNVTNSVFCLPY